jgi:hypothetical protein
VLTSSESATGRSPRASPTSRAKTLVVGQGKYASADAQDAPAADPLDGPDRAAGVVKDVAPVAVLCGDAVPAAVEPDAGSELGRASRGVRVCDDDRSADLATLMSG